MSKRGVKPRPTPLKLLAGVQPCRVNLEEPTAPAGAPEAPGYLRADARAVEFWDEHAPMLAGMGVLTKADRHALALLCDSFSRWQSDRDDHKRREEFRKLLAEFGLTPSSRSGLKVREKPRDDLGDFLASRKA